MKIQVVKKLVETHTLDQLRKAENDIAEGLTPEITIEGADEGEQLTHAYAAFWIKEKMQNEQLDLNTALRAYTQMVRKSID